MKFNIYALALITISFLLCVFLFSFIISDCSFLDVKSAIHDYQTLIAGVLAVIAALIAAFMNGAFLKDSNKHAANEKQRAFLQQHMDICVRIQLDCAEILRDKDPSEKIDELEILKGLRAYRDKIRPNRLVGVKRDVGYLSKDLYGALSQVSGAQKSAVSGRKVSVILAKSEKLYRELKSLRDSIA